MKTNDTYGRTIGYKSNGYGGKQEQLVCLEPLLAINGTDDLLNEILPRPWARCYRSPGALIKAVDYD